MITKTDKYLDAVKRLETEVLPADRWQLAWEKDNSRFTLLCYIVLGHVFIFQVFHQDGSMHAYMPDQTTRWDELKKEIDKIVFTKPIDLLVSEYNAPKRQDYYRMIIKKFHAGEFEEAKQMFNVMRITEKKEFLCWKLNIGEVQHFFINLL